MAVASFERAVRFWRLASVHKSCNIGNLSILERASGFATSWAFAILLVGSEVERDEEEKIGADYSHSGESGEFLSSAFARIWHPWEIGGGEVGVGREVDEAKINDELDDLETSDPFLPPDLDATRALEVVPVHDNVNHKVERNWDP